MYFSDKKPDLKRLRKDETVDNVSETHLIYLKKVSVTENTNLSQANSASVSTPPNNSINFVYKSKSLEYRKNKRNNDITENDCDDLISLYSGNCSNNLSVPLRLANMQW